MRACPAWCPTAPAATTVRCGQVVMPNLAALLVRQHRLQSAAACARSPTLPAAAGSTDGGPVRAKKAKAAKKGKVGAGGKKKKKKNAGSDSGSDVPGLVSASDDEGSGSDISDDDGAAACAWR